jgi:carboxymethylenebutenolidase
LRRLQLNFGSFAAAIAGALLAALALAPAASAAQWKKGEFQSDGKTVTDYICVPSAPGARPAIVLLHGAGGGRVGYGAFERMCSELAADGFYTEFIEYFSQTGSVRALQRRKMAQDFPTWLAEIDSGIDAMRKNPAVDSKRIALMGFSLGAFLSLSTGALEPHKVAAIVEYYGGLVGRLKPRAAEMPPTLILHGDKDVLVPVADAHELDALLTRYHRPHEIHIYPGANHAFNFPGLRFWYNAADAADAWKRSIAFLDANLHNPPSSASASAK